MDVTQDDAPHEHDDARGSGHEHELVTELRRAVAARLTHDDVAVRPHDGGFTLAYVAPLVREGVASSSSTRTSVLVRCEPATLTYLLEDVVATRSVTRHGASASVVRGRSGGSVVAVYGRRPDGTWGRLSHQAHRPARLHAVVRGAGAELGWRERRPASVVVATVAAGVAVGGLVVGGLVVAVLALTGALPA